VRCLELILVKNSSPYDAGPYYAKRSKKMPLRASVIRANKVLLSMFAMKKTQGMFQICLQ